MTIHRTRRQALGTLATLATAASLPQLARAAPRRVAIVGGGMAGVSCAWLLDGANEVVLFESRSTLGGNVRTVDVEVGGANYRVDLGAQFFHPAAYPAYTQLLEQLGLYPPAPGGSHAFPASITLADPSEGQPRFVSPVLPGRVWPLAASWNRAGIEAFNTAFSAAKRRERLNAPWSLTLGEWLPTLGLSPAQWEGMVLPWAASLFSGDIEQTRGLSARAAMVFAAKVLPDRPTDPVVYYVLDAGMIEALNRMVNQFTTVQVQLNAAVNAVSRTAAGRFLVQAGAGPATEFDDIVFAAAGPATLSLLAGLDGTAAQRAALQGIELYDSRLMLHGDPLYAPASPALQSFLNCQVQGASCEASMSLARVLTPQGPTPPALWKSWVTHRQQLPAQVLHDVSYRHVLTTPATITAQDSLRALQGQGGLWFAGGWTQPFDAQETALLSAMAVADGFGAARSRR